MKSFAMVLTCSLFCGVISTPAFAYSSDYNYKGIEYNELRFPHFIVYYDKSVSESYANKLGDMGERFYTDITEEFNFMREEFWTWENRAKIFVAKDKNLFQESFSCPAWSAACVDYVHKEVFTYPDQVNFDAVLAHELTHIIFYEYTKNIAVPLWFNEGVALYIQENKADTKWFGDKFPLYLRRIIKDTKYISFTEILNVDSAELDSKSQLYVNIFYIQAYAMVDFLIKKYGRDGFAYFLYKLRDSRDFKAAMISSFEGLSTPEEFEERWKDFYQE